MVKVKSTRATHDKGLQQIAQDLGACRQTLMCAAEALAKAEDDGFEGESGELGASAIRVVERCTEQLVGIEDRIDRLSVAAAVRS